MGFDFDNIVGALEAKFSRFNHTHNLSDITNLISILNDKASKDELDGKVDKDGSKQLSTNDYTTLEKQKLESLENYDDTDIFNLVNTKANINHTQDGTTVLVDNEQAPIEIDEELTFNKKIKLEFVLEDNTIQSFYLWGVDIND